MNILTPRTNNSFKNLGTSRFNTTIKSPLSGRKFSADQHDSFNRKSSAHQFSSNWRNSKLNSNFLNQTVAVGDEIFLSTGRLIPN